MSELKREEFEDWCNMWDAVCETDPFKPQERNVVPEVQATADFNNTPQDFYWNHLAGESELLTEKADTKIANPVQPDSVGMDQEVTQDAWVSEDFVSEISDLKKRLYDLEVDRNKKDVGGENWVETPTEVNTSSDKAIEDLRQKIDDLANRLGRENEPKGSEYSVEE